MKLARFRGTQLPPAGVVRLAELVGGVLGPQHAERKQALRPQLRRGRLGPGGPHGRVRASRVLPGGAVARAQAVAAAAIAAVGHRAGRQLAAPVQRRAGIGEERGQVRAPAVAPPVPVGGAEPVFGAGPVAAVSRALPPAQDRVARIRDQDASAELAADHADELPEEPRPAGCLAAARARPSGFLPAAAEHGRGQADGHRAAAVRRVQPGRPAPSLLLAALTQPQGLLPGAEDLPHLLRRRQPADPPGDHRAGRAGPSR